jgi:CheY-like chemotaxis protein
MKMPQMGGLEFLRRLRDAPGLNRLPVGVITGDYFLGEAVLHELGQLGASVRYKPIRMEDLAALTDQLLAPIG